MPTLELKRNRCSKPGRVERVDDDLVFVWSVPWRFDVEYWDVSISIADGVVRSLRRDRIRGFVLRG